MFWNINILEHLELEFIIFIQLIFLFFIINKVKIQEKIPSIYIFEKKKSILEENIKLLGFLSNYILFNILIVTWQQYKGNLAEILINNFENIIIYLSFLILLFIFKLNIFFILKHCKNIIHVIFFIFIIWTSLHGLILMIKTNEIITIYFSIEIFSQSLFFLILLFIINTKGVKQIKMLYTLLYYVIYNGIFSAIFVGGISSLYENTSNLNLLIISKIFNISYLEKINFFFIPIYESNNFTQDNFLGCLAFFFFFIFKLYIYPFHIVYNRLIGFIPIYIYIYNLLIPKIYFIYMLYKLINLLRFGIAIEIVEYLIILSISSFGIASLFMLNEKKIREFLFYSSLANNSFIITLLILFFYNKIVILLILFYYYFCVLIICYIWNNFIIYNKKNNSLEPFKYFYQFRLIWLEKNKWINQKYLFFFSIFTLSALAPTFSFLLKYLVVYNLFIMSSHYITIILLLFSIINSIAYLLLFFSLIPVSHK